MRRVPPCSSRKPLRCPIKSPTPFCCWVCRCLCSVAGNSSRSGSRFCCRPPAMRWAPGIGSFPRWRFSRWRLYPLVPAPGAAQTPHRDAGCRRSAARVLVRRHRPPGSVSGRMYRHGALWNDHRGDALFGVPIRRGLCRRIPLCGPAVRLFRCGDRLGPLRRPRSGPYLGRDDHLLSGAISVFPLRPHNSGFTCGG